MKKRTMPIGFILLCVVPVVILMVVFMIIPTVEALTLSFTNSTGMSDNFDFVGLKNYTYLFKDFGVEEYH